MSRSPELRPEPKPLPMPTRRAGRGGLALPALGYGSFKIGRATGTKYPTPFSLPSDAEAAAVLHRALDLGLRAIDTAPAYGLSEARIGAALAGRRSEFVLSTKVGERHDGDRSIYDFAPRAVRESLVASVARLGGPVDITYVHADGGDVRLAEDHALIAALVALRSEGLTRLIGFSGKSAASNRIALAWADAIMIEYHTALSSAEMTAVESTMRDASDRGVVVVVKKALASGHLDPEVALRFVLANPHVDCAIVGGLDLQHLARNAAIAAAARG